MARRKSRIVEEDNPERWMVSFADFITLLFAFFAILYATSEANQTKLQQFEKSMRKQLVAFGVIGQGGGPSTQKGQAADKVLQNPVKRQQQQGNKGSGQEALGAVETFIVANLSEGQVEKYVKEIDMAAVGIRLSLSADEVFSGRSSKIRREALKILNKIGQLVKSQNRKVWVEGHMDGKSMDAKAWDVAGERAQTLARYLIKIHNIPASLVAAVSYGPERPLFPNTSEKNRSSNRRIDLLILTQDTPI